MSTLPTSDRDNKRVTFGKLEGKTYAEAYDNRTFVRWVLSVKYATRKLKDIQEYFEDREGVQAPIPVRQYISPNAEYMGNPKEGYMA
jgi:hypothetical protein